MIVYISGPISGREDGNRDAFLAAQIWAEGKGHKVLNPHEICANLPETIGGWESLSSREQWRHYMRRCLAYMTLLADLVFVLDGWQESEGACVEVRTAQDIDIPVRFQTPVEEV